DLTYQGGLSGPAVDTDTIAVYPDNSITAAGVEVCAPNACTMGGRSGGFTAIFVYRGGPGTWPTFPACSGVLNFTKGTGGFYGLAGGGTFDCAGNYRYYFSFRP